MKHLKHFENNIEIIGEFVICNEQEANTTDVYKKIINNFLSTNIGLCVKYDSKRSEYEIEYENVPTDILQHYFFINSNNKNKHIRYMRIDEIIYHSKNKEDLEHYIQANKYNL